MFGLSLGRMGNLGWRGKFASSSLNLNFVSSSQVLDPRITFTRASAGTRFNSAGTLVSMSNNEPRFDYDPVTLQPKGLLLEEQRTNLCLQSAALATLPWFNGGLTSLTNNSTDVLAPDGQYTATKAVVAASAGIVGQPITLTTTTYAGSIWLRCSSGTVTASLTVYLSASPFTNIGAQNITITTSWQRFTILTTTATAASYNLQVHQMSGGTVYLWGAQLEAGAFPTSYIPTTTAAATRAADVATMTGANFSNWYNQTEGTFFTDIQGTSIISGATRRGIEVSDGSVVNRHIVGYNESGSRAITVVSNVFVTNLTVSAAIGSPLRIAYGYVASGSASTVNGSLPALGSPASIPSVNQMRLGADANTTIGTVLNGHIKRIAYYPRRLSNSELQGITA